MPDLDARLRDAVREGARSPLDGDVMTSVAAKRAHRRVVHRVQVGAVAALSVLAVVAASFVVLDGGDDHTTRVAAGPAPSDTPEVRIVGPDRTRSAEVHFVGLDRDEGYVRGPLVVQGDVITAAAYDRAGDSYTVPPSRIVRFTPDGHVLDRVNLQGEVLSLAAGEGARWALTHDKEVGPPPDPEYRIKRIGPNGGVASNAVPRGEVPAGDIYAGGGAVWLPVTDGVLRFDTVTGAFAGKVQLPTSDEHRAVAEIFKGAVVTDGTVLRRLDAQQGIAPIVNGADAPPGLEYRDIAPGDGLAWAVGVDDSGASFLWQMDVFGNQGRSILSGAAPGARSFVTVRDVNWLELVLDGQPALRRFPDPPVGLSTIRTDGVADGSLSPVGASTAVLLDRGSVFRVDLGR